MTARRVLRRELQRLSQAGLPTHRTESEINTLTAALEAHSNIFPGISKCLFPQSRYEVASKAAPLQTEIYLSHDRE